MHRTQDASRIVTQHILWAAGAGLVPLPVLDVASVTLIQLNMLNQLAHLYGSAYSTATARAFISSLTGSALARLGASLVKTLPGVGSVVGGLSMSVLAGASAYALGHVAMRMLETGGTLTAVPLLEARRWYTDAFEEGTQAVAKLQTSIPSRSHRDAEPGGEQTAETDCRRDRQPETAVCRPSAKGGEERS